MRTRLAIPLLLLLAPVARAEPDPQQVHDAWNRLQAFGCKAVAFQAEPDPDRKPGLATVLAASHRPLLLVFPPDCRVLGVPPAPKGPPPAAAATKPARVPGFD